MHIEKISNEEIRNTKPSVGEVRAKQRVPVYALLDGIRSSFNVGNIFRTCDAALVSRIFLTGITPCPPQKSIDKSALGATDVVPWEYCPDPSSVIRELKSQGVRIVALELTHQSVQYSKAIYNFPVCLVIGNEVSGISPEVIALCDEAIDIPMLGRANSLNVATAFGIAIYEILKQSKYVKT